MCKKDCDIEEFLIKKAILFEKSGKSRTFLIYNEDDEEQFSILAYFTLALQVLKVPETYSNRRLKSLDGFNAKINGERITEFPCILIGQLAKNDLYQEAICGDEIMHYCLGTVLEGQKRVGGRIILLECKNIPYLIELYRKFGFVKLEKDYGENELLQFIKILTDDELIESTAKIY